MPDPEITGAQFHKRNAYACPLEGPHELRRFSGSFAGNGEQDAPKSPGAETQILLSLYGPTKVVP
jgi:hypothetical protein